MPKCRGSKGEKPASCLVLLPQRLARELPAPVPGPPQKGSTDPAGGDRGVHWHSQGEAARARILFPLIPDANLRLSPGWASEEAWSPPVHPLPLLFLWTSGASRVAARGGLGEGQRAPATAPLSLLPGAGSWLLLRAPCPRRKTGLLQSTTCSRPSAADLSADPAAVVRRGQHQSSAGQEGHSGELAALLLGRRQWETMGAGSLPTHRGWFGSCVCPGGAVWSTTESQTWDSEKEPCGLTSPPRPTAAGTTGSLPARRGNRKLTLSFRFVRVFQNVP